MNKHNAMPVSDMVMIDGNEAAAWIAYKVSEICAIYPITPSSTMAELADEWSTQLIPNIWGNIPTIIEMQHEGGAAGAVHGALQAGALSTTFTASQGLMLMIPNMYKIAGELTSTVFHVAARSLAAQGLSIFGDHQDVMATRATGFALLSSASVQQAQDMAMIAHSVTLSTRIPFLHFFDGFRTSHEINKISRLSDDQIKQMICDQQVREHRGRALNPDQPFMRGTAQNPDTYFQSRETVNSFYDRVPDVVEQTMERFAELTGRQYHLVEYHGAADAEHVIVIMGSGASTVKQTVDTLNANGSKFGVVTVHLYRPFPGKNFISAFPETTKFVTVLDRTKEPGSNGEPLYQDTVSAFVSAVQHQQFRQLPRISGGRYGLSSKEFTPAMVKAVFEEQQKVTANDFFTIGITDDVTHLSLPWDEAWQIEPANRVRALFFGLGADGTVGANKNSIKIIGELPAYFAQGYFVYDSKKSGSRTVSHLRFGPEPIDAPAFVREVTAEMLQERGDRIPVSLLPADGTYPTATSQWEKRNIAQEIPQWHEDLCIQCGNCSFVCPHAAIRAKFYHKDLAEDAPSGAKWAPISARGFPDTLYTLQVYPEDCTGCGLCVEACPVRADDAKHRAISMTDKLPILEREKRALGWFNSLPWPKRSTIDFSTIRGVQFLEPLFEFSGACAGCGETPYLKTLTQLFGDRMMVANATGCSSIYGGNLPTTPWAKNSEGKGPAWSNSLFEDNAEFGLGFRLTADHHRTQASAALRTMTRQLGSELIEQIINAPQQIESQIQQQRERLLRVRALLANDNSGTVLNLQSLLDHLIRRSVWIIGGDGWAYDIGSSGLDHVIASGKDINILVMDTEVYSNTGGQMSKSTPLGAVAKFAAGGKTMAKKDMALQAIAYGNVYVARIAFGANPQQALQAMREAEAYPGPSLIIAYSHCIAHGLDMRTGLIQQKRAVASGHWPLIRYNPILREQGRNPFTLDSLRPTIPLYEYRKYESRYQTLLQLHPEEAQRLMEIAQKVVDQKWTTYEGMALYSAEAFHPDARR